jgi:hypothetical protein
VKNVFRVLNVCLVVCMVLVPVRECVARALSVEELVEERSANVWVEGQDLGGMIVGARGQMTFVYVDNVLSRASGGESEAPEWLKWHVQHFLSDAVKGKILFICRYRALIPWTFDPEQIFVGNYAVQWKDILTRKDFFPHGEISSDTAGVFAFVVPSEEIVPGKEIRLGYGEYATKLRIPGR